MIFKQPVDMSQYAKDGCSKCKQVFTGGERLYRPCAQCRINAANESSISAMQTRANDRAFAKARVAAEIAARQIGQTTLGVGVSRTEQKDAS